LKDFIKMYGDISKKAMLENVEIRMANLAGTPCASNKVQMHDKSIITENYTTFGSYSLSAFARVGNWESITVVDAQQLHKDKFDEIWNQIPKRHMENYYTELYSPTKGPKRKTRQQDPESEHSTKKQAAK
jgi:hypothetical protein